MDISHPGHAAHLMLEHKGIDHGVRNLMPGFQPILLRAAGFRRGTTPGLNLNGRRIQGSREISAALDEIQPDPPLFPAEPEAREAVLAAEEWGEKQFQPVPRRLLRWGFHNDRDMLRRELRDTGIPAGLAFAFAPVTTYFVHISGATEARVRADLARLPALLEEVDRLIAEGTIGGALPNAADFQIATTARLLSGLADLSDLVAPSAAGELGARLCPEFEHRIPPFLPTAWLPLP
jgi:glutathione S-transferase